MVKKPNIYMYMSEMLKKCYVVLFGQNEAQNETNRTKEPASGVTSCDQMRPGVTRCVLRNYSSNYAYVTGRKMRI